MFYRGATCTWYLFIRLCPDSFRPDLHRLQNHISLGPFLSFLRIASVFSNRLFAAGLVGHRLAAHRELVDAPQRLIFGDPYFLVDTIELTVIPCNEVRQTPDAFARTKLATRNQSGVHNYSAEQSRTHRNGEDGETQSQSRLFPRHSPRLANWRNSMRVRDSAAIVGSARRSLSFAAEAWARSELLRVYLKTEVRGQGSEAFPGAGSSGLIFIGNETSFASWRHSRFFPLLCISTGCRGWLISKTRRTPTLNSPSCRSNRRASRRVKSQLENVVDLSDNFLHCQSRSFYWGLEFVRTAPRLTSCRSMVFATW